MPAKILWPKLNLKAFLTRPGKSAEERGNRNLWDKASVNEEYREAFRTKSYIEMWGKVQGQLRSNSTAINATRLPSSSSSSSSSSVPNFFAGNLLIEPRQEALLNMLGALNPDPLLMDYFNASLEACNTCEMLLRSVHQTRAGHRKIRKVIKLSQRLQEGCGCGATDCEEQCRRAIFAELARIALLKNPLSAITLVDFGEIHDSNTVLLRRLTSKHKKVRRRAKLNRWGRRAGGFSLVVSHSAVMVAMLVLAFHSVLGIVAAPGIMGCGVGMVRKRVKDLGLVGTGMMERVCAQLDVAAKGVYILVNDFDTISRLVRRLHDEVEHQRTIAGMCVRMRNGKADEVLKEVVREFCIHESCFLEQLEELEQHIHLCFLTINRSRRLVTDEVLVGQ